MRPFYKVTSNKRWYAFSLKKKKKKLMHKILFIKFYVQKFKLVVRLVMKYI
jgi:hypothetical protein